MAAPPYRFNYGIPGNFIEIYLPKKAVYQGALYETLTNGFKLDLVKEHFRERGSDVKEFLKEHEKLWEYTSEQIARLSPSYNGYSLYELDGVFRSSPMPDSEFELVEERVQVIRLMFLPPDDVLGEFDGNEKRQLAARRYLRFWTQNVQEYTDDLTRCDRSGDLEIAVQLSKWLEDVALFLHGYILFKLCEEIDNLKNQNGIKAREKEIWMTNSRWPTVVKTTLREGLEP
jgi:hypothetical protein